MKKLLGILAVAVAMTTACTKLGIPTVEFGKLTGFIYPGTETTAVDVKINLAQDADVTVGVRVNYLNAAMKELATKEIDLTIPAGQLSGTLEIPNDYRTAEEKESLEAASSARLTITKLPDGFMFGTKLICLLAPSVSEAVIYSFQSNEANLIESYIATIELTGTVSGKEFKTETAISWPAVITGEGAQYVEAGEFVAEAGSNKATLKITVKDGVKDVTAPIVVSVDTPEGVIAGDEPELLGIVRGLPGKSLVGTWAFREVIDEEEIQLWYMEMEDYYPEESNAGFEFTIAADGDKYKFTPNTTGHFANYYRTAGMSLCAPKNPAANAVTLGSYTVEQINGFVGEVYNPYQQAVFFELDKANRSFDNSSESLGKGYISVSYLSDDELIVTIHDYDEPPFAFMWWDPEAFDCEMLGFASVFTRK